MCKVIWIYDTTFAKPYKRWPYGCAHLNWIDGITNLKWCRNCTIVVKSSMFTIYLVNPSVPSFLVQILSLIFSIRQQFWSSGQVAHPLGTIFWEIYVVFIVFKLGVHKRTLHRGCWRVLCYRLNVCVPSKSIGWNPNPKCDDIKRWGPFGGDWVMIVEVS